MITDVNFSTTSGILRRDQGAFVSVTGRLVPAELVISHSIDREPGVYSPFEGYGVNYDNPWEGNGDMERKDLFLLIVWRGTKLFEEIVHAAIEGLALAEYDDEPGYFRESVTLLNRPPACHTATIMLLHARSKAMIGRKIRILRLFDQA